MSIEEFHFEVNIPLEENVNFLTLVTPYEDGKEQRRKKWSTPKRDYNITLRGKNTTVSQQVWDFYTSRSGAYETFYFQNPNENPVTNEALGTGNGVNKNFQLANYPLPSGAITITDQGYPLTETTNYTLTRSSGAIVCNVAPTGDMLGTYNFSRIVRFAEDNLSRELFNYKLYNLGVKLLEVLG